MANNMKQLKVNAENGSYAFDIMDQTARSAAQEAKDAVGKISIPTSLPNPKKLIFTGGATGEYDGSNEVTITIPAAGEGGSSGSSPIKYHESLDRTNPAFLRDLESGSYVLYGYYKPFNGSSNNLSFDGLLANVVNISAGSHILVFSTLNSKVDFLAIEVDSTQTSGYKYERTSMSLLDLNALIAKVGNLNSLSTTEKSSLVAAINEVAASQGSGGNANQGTGLTATEKNLMLTLFKAVPYISDVSATMKSLEAIWAGSSSGGETPDIPDVTNYTVTYNLTSVTADSTPASVVEGGSLTVNLTPDTNAVLGEVVVTMGGVDVTATAYSNGKISISSVTGNVVITATATVANYTQVEYLESAGGAWINTGYAPKTTDTVEVVFSMVRTTWSYIFSEYCGNGAYTFRSRGGYDGNATSFTRSIKANPTTVNDATTGIVTALNTVYRFKETEPGTGILYDESGNELGTLTDANVSSISEPFNNLLLFVLSSGRSRYGTAEAGNRIHSFKVTDVYGNAALDLIPVLDENDVACMYDKVSGNFIYDAEGGNTFIAGGAV